MPEILQYEFIRNAIIASVLVNIICGIVGTYIVIKKIALICYVPTYATPTLSFVQTTTKMCGDPCSQKRDSWNACCYAEVCNYDINCYKRNCSETLPPSHAASENIVGPSEQR